MKKLKIVWEDPDAPPDKLTELVALLKKHTGRWARVLTYRNRNTAASTAHSLKKRTKGIEWTVRTGTKGAGIVYARARKTYKPKPASRKKGKSQ